MKVTYIPHKNRKEIFQFEYHIQGRLVNFNTGYTHIAFRPFMYK